MNNKKGETLYLKPEELKFLCLAAADLLEDVKKAAKDDKLNFTPEARKYLKEMTEAGQSVKIKFAGLGLDWDKLPDYEPGDEREFLTNES